MFFFFPLSLSLCMYTLIHRYRDTYIERESQRMRERERDCCHWHGLICLSLQTPISQRREMTKKLIWMRHVRIHVPSICLKHNLRANAVCLPAQSLPDPNHGAWDKLGAPEILEQRVRISQATISMDTTCLNLEAACCTCMQCHAQPSLHYCTTCKNMQTLTACTCQC